MSKRCGHTGSLWKWASDSAAFVSHCIFMVDVESWRASCSHPELIADLYVDQAAVAVIGPARAVSVCAVGANRVAAGTSDGEVWFFDLDTPDASDRVIVDGTDRNWREVTELSVDGPELIAHGVHNMKAGCRINIYDCGTVQPLGEFEGRGTYLLSTGQRVRLSIDSQGLLLDRDDDASVQFRCPGRDVRIDPWNFVVTTDDAVVAFAVGELLVWELASPQDPRVIPIENFQALCLLALQDGRVAVGGYWPRRTFDCNSELTPLVRIWDLRSVEDEPDTVVDGHYSFVRNLVQLADGRLVTSGDDTAFVTDLATGDQTALPGLVGRCDLMSGGRIVGPWRGGGIAIWSDGESVPNHPTVTSGQTVIQIRVLPDRQLVTAGAGVAIWDLERRSVTAELYGTRGFVNALATLDDGIVAVTTERSEAISWSPAQHTRPVLIASGRKEDTEAMDGRGSTLAFSSFRGDLQVWDMKSRRKAFDYAVQEGRQAIHVLDDGQIAVGDYPDVLLLSADGESSRRLDQMTQSVEAAATAADVAAMTSYGTKLFVVRSRIGHGDVVQVWSHATEELLKTLPLQQGHRLEYGSSQAIKADERFLVAMAEAGLIYIWDYNDSDDPTIVTIDPARHTAPGICLDGQFLYVGLTSAIGVLDLTKLSAR